MYTGKGDTNPPSRPAYDDKNPKQADIRLINFSPRILGSRQAHRHLQTSSSPFRYPIVNSTAAYSSGG